MQVNSLIFDLYYQSLRLVTSFVFVSLLLVSSAKPYLNQKRLPLCTDPHPMDHRAGDSIIVFFP